MANPEVAQRSRRPWRLTGGEVSGGLADLAVLVPLEVSLIAINGLNPTTTLLGVGVTYILAGLYFRIPMPVQPLKAFAVIAVAHQLPPSAIAAGALLMAAALGFLAATGLANLIARAVPLAVVRGVQMGLGLLLLKGAFDIFWSRPFFIGGDRRLVEIAGVAVPLGLAVGLAGIALLLLAIRWRLPATVLVLTAGAVLGLLLGALTGFRGMALGPVPFGLNLPRAEDFARALPLLVVPQIALTLANSVVATVDAARTYYGDQAARVTPRRLCLSMVLANLWAGLFGGLPACHGSGGVTAHYRLGARTPVATIFVGLLLVAVALVFGKAALPVRAVIPYAVFGALLFYVGWQHLLLGLKVPPPQLALVIPVAVVSVLPGSSLAWGLAAGMAAWWGLRLAGPRLPRALRRRAAPVVDSAPSYAE